MWQEEDEEEMKIGMKMMVGGGRWSSVREGGVSSTMIPKHPQVRLASEALQLKLL